MVNPKDEVFDGGLATPVPKSTLYDAMRAGSYTAVFESLQAQLKTRDGKSQGFILYRKFL